MALVAEQLLPAGPAAAAATPSAAANEQWVRDACCVRLDADGNVVTQIPALLACAISRLVDAAESHDAALHPAQRCYQPTRLHGCRPPAISIEAYAQRLLCYCKCSPACYVAAFAYMRRLHTGSGGVQGGRLRVDALTAHRLMAVGAVIAVKFLEDRYYSNAHYAQVAGVSLREWNAMELDMLFRLNFRARVDIAEMGAALREMEALAFGQAGLPAMLAPAGVCRAGRCCSAAPGAPAAAAVASGFVRAAAATPASAHGAREEAAKGSEGDEEGSMDTAATTLATASSEELMACAASSTAPAFTPTPTPAPSAAPAAAVLLPWAAAAATGPASAPVPAAAAAVATVRHHHHHQRLQPRVAVVATAPGAAVVGAEAACDASCCCGDAAGAAAAGAGEDARERTAPPRRSKKRCNAEAAPRLLSSPMHEERQRAADLLQAAS